MLASCKQKDGLMRGLGNIVADIALSSPKPLAEREFFGAGSRFTSHTVMTLAIARALMEAMSNESQDSASALVLNSSLLFGKWYPVCGFGSRFSQQIDIRDNSFTLASGVAQCIAPVAWLFNNLEDVLTYTKLIAGIFNNPPEASRDAAAIAAGIFLLRQGATQKDVYDILERKLDWPVIKAPANNLSQARLALSTCFEASSFRDALEKSRDNKERALMCAALAEARHGIDRTMYTRALAYLDIELIDVVESYETMSGQNQYL